MKYFSKGKPEAETEEALLGTLLSILLSVCDPKQIAQVQNNQSDLADIISNAIALGVGYGRMLEAEVQRDYFDGGRGVDEDLTGAEESADEYVKKLGE